MLESFIKFGFSAGVLDPKLHGRGDLKNYDLGLAEARNWCVDYLGGLFTRPGTEFRDYASGGTSGNCRLIPFQFNNDLANTYLIVISPQSIRFMQDGDYVLESTKTISNLAATITVSSHGYSNDQWVKILGQTYVVANATTSTFTLVDFFGNTVDLSGTGATSVARVYRLDSPYSEADLPLLKYSQDGDVIYLNHPTYAERKLTRVAADNWTIATTDYIGYDTVVTGVTCNPSTTGAAGMAYAVTIVNRDGLEGPLGPDGFFVEIDSVDFTATAGHATISWNRNSEAAYYNVYRSLIIPDGDDANIGMDLGFIGSTETSVFTDNNIVPDFTRTPLERTNPFARLGIVAAPITNAGTGYDPNVAEVDSSGGGTGFSAIPVIVDGLVRAIKILDPGQNYSSPSVTVDPNGGGGSGAVALTETSPASGIYPSCGAKVQQRRVRGGTINSPLGIFGSRIGEPDSYATSNSGLASDPYILVLDAETQTPIRHIVASTEGFFAFCDDGVFLVRGIDDNAITVTSAKSAIQTAQGSAHLPPIKIDREVLYLSSEYDSVHAIGPSNLPTYFTTVDRSVLSSHYFDEDNRLVSWTWAKAPHKLIWAAREDGTFLSCAYLANQEVYAWTNHSTAGYVREVTSIRENGADRVYAIVDREVNGTTVRLIERLALQEPETEEDMWAVDSGVRSALTYPAAGITVSALSGEITVTASSSIFSAGDVGKAFRAGGGRGTVLSSPAATQLIVELDVDILQPIPELSTRSFAAGEWSLTEKFSSFSGLQHLEGQTVEVLADGAEVETAVVTDGAISLVAPASYVVAGLGFTGRFKTLPPSISGAVLEGREKNVKGLAVRLLKARGLEFGDGAGDVTYPLPTRSYETYGVAPAFKSGLHEISIRSGYDLDGSITCVKTGPQSAMVLGLVLETDIEG